MLISGDQLFFRPSFPFRLNSASRINRTAYEFDGF